MNIKSLIRTVPDYPKKGIMFRDVTSLIKNGEAFAYIIDHLYDRYKDMELDAIVGIESRGFIIGAALAYRLGLGFVPIRKKGKLPGDVFTQNYDLEYGSDQIEIHKDALNKNDKVILVDDLLATGGTAIGGKKLLDMLGVEIVECSFIVDLPDLGGTKKLKELGLQVYKLVDFEGE